VPEDGMVVKVLTAKNSCMQISGKEHV